MSYKTYTTEAIVCGNYNNNTADRSFLLFTEEAGMLYATARSVREERSKQRFALQDFSHIRVSLVKGKHGWRIGSVESLNNYFSAASDRATRGGVSAVMRLVRRFVTGEDPQSVVFADLCAALTQMQRDPVLVTEHFTLRFLAALGYIAPHPAYQTQLDATAWWEDLVPLPPEAGTAIERGLQASHL